MNNLANDYDEDNYNLKVLENNNKKFARNRSAKKEMEKRKMDDFAFKRKDVSNNGRK